MYYVGNAVTDIGTVKKVNQDSLTLKVANTKWGSASLAVVCDGVGGLLKGELASATVIRGFDRWFKEIFPYQESGWNEQNIQADWNNLIQILNQEIIAYGNNNGGKLGTTVTAALFIEDKYYVAHVGDCRMYQITDQLLQVTKDQTLVEHEVDMGIITRQQALTDPRKSVLLQSIGTTECIEVAFYSGTIQPDSTFLLCSDGFRHEIQEEEIRELLSPGINRSQNDIKGHLGHLVELNKYRGERDNISAILLWVG